MIIVATADFGVYHEVVGELRERGVAFTTVEPGDDLPERVDALITTAADRDAATGLVEHDAGVEVVTAEPGEPRRAVEAALTPLRNGGRTVVGVDPGDRPGIAVCSGGICVAAFHVPLADAVAVIEREIEDAADPVVRIGDGARMKGAGIVDALADCPVELVDETGTTPSLGTGASGMGDVLAAVNIARMEGERIERREIEPTVGELRAIKERSRERSDGRRTIDERLARRVAHGELTLEEALDEHRGEG